jgi:hypothetical protein
MKKFSSKSVLSEILKLKEGEEILHKHGVPCVSCPFAKMEMEKLQLGQICQMYGLDLKKILSDLNMPAKK